MSLTSSRWLYMWTLTTDGGLWHDQSDGMRKVLQDHSNCTCGLWQLTVGSDMTRVVGWEKSCKITATVRADSDNWQWALTRPGGQHEKPLTRSWQLYVQTLTADNELWQDEGDSMWSLWEHHGNYTDNWPWVLTSQCDCTSSLCQIVYSVDLAYIIIPCHVQTLLLSPWSYLVSTPRYKGKVEILW
jgi:hypothetical protein